MEKFPKLDVTEGVLVKLKNGLEQQTDAVDGLYRIYDNEDLVGLAKVQNGVNKFVTRLR